MMALGAPLRLLCLLLLQGKAAAQILASPKHDPGCHDVFGTFADELATHGDKGMDNLKAHPNDGEAPGANGTPHMVSEYEGYAAADDVLVIESAWRLDTHKRNFVLIVEDMEKGYESYVRYIVPPVKKLLQKFHELKLPVVWTNWVRRHNDGMYGAIDRHYGPRGVKEELNPAYIFDEEGIKTVDELAPETDEERSRTINSLHLNKFSDLDEEGREILFPMLKAWGVNTIVLTGAWTDDCIAATAFSAVDDYGMDVVLIKDAVATATIHGSKMVDVMCAAAAKCHTAEEVLSHLTGFPELIEAPKAPLHGDVYKKSPRMSTRSLEL
mmetsp:Transcript_68208/g.181504  ORF Transcript_68208/g.181504 Transcript_68208/m.181504 type:complete len:326 (-) Transcript_68208:81-1058(-)